MADILHRIGFKSSPAQVFQAFATVEGLSKWWTSETSGNAGAGGTLVFTFRTKAGAVVGEMTMEVEEIEGNAGARWRVVGGPEDWIGTAITFRLSVQDGQTILLFGHRNWREASESLAHCSMKWAVFLLSLKGYVDEGRGRPSPDDLKIDNWN